MQESESNNHDENEIAEDPVGQRVSPFTDASEETGIGSQAGGAPVSPAPSTAADAGEPANPHYVYALGRIEARFPTLAIEKEFAQVAARDAATGMTDRQTFRAVLGKPENRYLLRSMCWVFKIEGLETYLLVPRDPGDFGLLLEALRPEPSPMDMDVVIGVRGPLAPPTMCNGLMVPVVAFDQLYSFDRKSLIDSIPRPDETSRESFDATAEELVDRILQMGDNAGELDEHRALNYLIVRYPSIYATTANAFARNASLVAVEAHPSPLSGVRKIFEVVFSFANRKTDVTEKFFVRVDVTEQFPFLVTKMSPYYDR